MFSLHGNIFLWFCTNLDRSILDSTTFLLSTHSLLFIVENNSCIARRPPRNTHAYSHCRATDVHGPDRNKSVKTRHTRQRVCHINPTRSVFPFELKWLQELVPPGEFPRQPWLVFKVSEWLMVCHQSEPSTFHVASELPKCMDHC